MRNLELRELHLVSGGVDKQQSGTKPITCPDGYHYEDYVYQAGSGGGGGGGASASGDGISGSISGGGGSSQQTFTHFSGCVQNGQHRDGTGAVPDQPASASSSG